MFLKLYFFLSIIIFSIYEILQLDALKLAMLYN